MATTMAVNEQWKNVINYEVKVAWSKVGIYGKCGSISGKKYNLSIKCTCSNVGD